MDKKELQAIAQAAAKNIKTEADLNEFRQMLTKITVETALNAELDDHLASTSTNSQTARTTATATLTRPCKPKTASLNWRLPATGPVASSPSWSRNTSVDLPRWMTRSCSSTLRA